ncbi:MAG: hypothetical protein ACI9MR_000064 [Myxococcota bacterium]|jgi:hypothetical protein
MKRFLLLPVLCLAIAAPTGCDDDVASGPSPLGADARPTPGTQIDRTGRPAISTALVGTFATGDDKTAAKNVYNAATDVSTWDATFAGQIEGALGIYDALDAICGNQLIADQDPNDRYGFLAGALADDQLYVNAEFGTDTCIFLGVEGALVAGLDANCGGRRPADDVIERYYSVLAAGVLTGVDDGVTADASKFTSTFPFLAAP